MNKKRAMSPAVLTFIVVFLAIVIVGGILVSVRYITFENGKITLGKSHGLDLKAAYIDGEDVGVVVGRGSAEGNLTGIRFIFSKGEDNITVERYVALEEYGEKVFTFSSIEIPGITNYNEVSVAPIYASDSGETSVGEIKDTEGIASEPPSRRGGGGGGSGGGGSGTTGTGTNGNETNGINGNETNGINGNGDSGILSSVSGNNLVTDDLVVIPQNMQGYNTLIYDWRKHGTSVAVLNMPFDTEVSTTTVGAVKDYSIYSNDGTLGGGNASRMPVWTSSGISGGAYSFDGVDDYISVPASLLNNEQTVSFWMKPGEPVGISYNMPISSLKSQGTDHDGFRFLTNANTLVLKLYTAEGPNPSISEPIVYGEWYHVVGTWSNATGELKMYVNGNLINSNAFTYFTGTPIDLDIGRYNYQNNHYFNGTIDEVQVYNHALSVEQITAMYNNGIPRHNIMVSEETSVGDSWSVEVTPNNPTGDGTSVLSNTLTITGTGASDTTPPSTPTGLQASVVSDSRIDLSWSAASDNVGVIGYNIYRGGVKIGTAAGTSYSNTGLSSGTSYTYKVSAFDAVGNEGGQSAEATATTTTSSTSCDVTFSTTDNVASIVSASSEGTVFCFNPGVHRMHSISPKNGNSFIGEPGAVLSGARLLTSFTREGAYWVATGQTQEGTVHGYCLLPEYPRCKWPEDLFFDDVPLRHVASLADVNESGEWFFDYGADKIYFIDDPTGHTVETSVTRNAFLLTADYVTIRGLIIEKYANPAQEGAIKAGTGSSLSDGWVIENNEIRLNHGIGIRVGHRSQVVNNIIHNNGQMGMGGSGSDILVENNEISYNNFAGYKQSWEAGATKFVWTSNLIARGNYVHDNIGSGLWTDINNINTLYENNIVEDNTKTGIFHEISYAAIIRNNTVQRNSFGNTGWIGGCGIKVSGSPNVEVYDNTLRDNYGGVCVQQQDRDDEGPAYGSYTVKNLSVHDNNIRMSAGLNGMVIDFAPPDGVDAYFTTWNNHFENNDYTLGGTGKRFAWMHSTRTDAEWVAYGNDDTGTITRI
jgi:parallel beta-helix repeat protein